MVWPKKEKEKTKQKPLGRKDKRDKKIGTNKGWDKVYLLVQMKMHPLETPYLMQVQLWAQLLQFQLGQGYAQVWDPREQEVEGFQDPQQPMRQKMEWVWHP